MANNKLVTVDVLQYNNEKIKEQLNKKVNIAQGVDNKDKILQVNAEGNLTLVDMPDEVKVSAEEGNAITSNDDGLYVPSVSETKVSQAEGNTIETKEDGIYVAPTKLDDYAKTEEVEKLIEDELYISSTIPSHYELAESTTPNALEVVADGTTLTDGQIEQSSVTDLAVEVGDYVVFVDEVTTTDTKYALKDDTYTKLEVDQKIADAVTGGTVDLSDYVKNEDLTTTLEDYVAEDEVKVMTVEELEALIGLSDEELEGLATVISDSEVRTDKTYSSSKIYTELQKLLTESKTYTLEEIAKKTGASYKIAVVTADMTSTEYIYLLANGDTYDMYIVETEGSTPVKIGTTDIDLSDYYTIEKIDNLYVLKTTVGDLSYLATETKKNIVDAVNEVYYNAQKTYATKTAMGELTELKTADKTSVVNAINELELADYNATKTYATKTDVGEIVGLKTTDKSSIVNAINENHIAIYNANKQHATKTEVGELTVLKTTDKSSIVNAINENYNTIYNTNKAVDNIINGTTSVPKADTVDGWHIYTSMTELNLSGSVTMTDVITAMPNKSELRFTNNTTNPNYVSDVPGQYGFLTIKKNFYAEATWIAVNRKTIVPMYFGSWHSDNGWTGWSSSETSHLSNPNLLDNPDFSINQRGLTKYNGAVYTVDRWTLGKDTTLLNVIDNGIKLGYVADSSPTDPAICIQRIENPTRFAGKTVTATVCVEETTSVQAQMLVRCTTEDGTTTYINKTFSTIGTHSVTGVIPDAKITKLELWLYGADIRVDGDTVDSYTIFNWVKLEVGSVATPFVSPHPATEWSKCQRYYQDLGGCPIFGIAISTDTLRMSIPANGKLYPKTPTLTVDGYHNTGEFSIGVLDCATGTRVNFTDLPTVEFKRFENSVLNCTLTFSGASFTQYKSYALLPVGEFRFYVSADL